MKNNESLISQHHPIEIKRRLNEVPKQNIISDAVLGGIDGCVTTFAVVSGAIGAGFSSSVAIILGFANLFADGFSMAISNFESVKAQREFAKTIRKSEKEHIDIIPEGEREEIRQIFMNKGFKGEILEKIVSTISDNEEIWLETMLMEEHGLQKTSYSPYKSAISTFISFLFIGTMPLVPFLFTASDQQVQFISSAILAGIMFFLIGAIKSYLFSRPILWSGFKTFLTGGTAAALAYLTGFVLQNIYGIS